MFKQLCQRNRHLIKSLFHGNIIQKCNFGDKFREFSDVEEVRQKIGPLLQSITQTDAFKSVSPQFHVNRKAKSRIERVAWKRDHGKTYINENRMYSDILSCKSAQEIRDVLSSYKEQQNYTSTTASSRKKRIIDILEGIVDEIEPPKQEWLSGSTSLSQAYAKAIETCAKIQEFDEGLKIFDEAKSDPRNSLNGNVFGAAMFLIMKKQFDQDGLNKCYKLLNEMINDYHCKPSPLVFEQLISNSNILFDGRRASKLVNKIIHKMDENEQRKLFRGRNGQKLQLCIISFFAQKMRIEDALKFMNNNIGRDSFTDKMYSILISGIAKVVQFEDKSMVDVAEQLFEQTFKVFDRAPIINVFVSLINVYAVIPDVHSCIDVVEKMTENNSWPNPTIGAYGACLKALILDRTDKLDYQQGWELIDKILTSMETNDVEKDKSTYSLLFCLCGGRFCNKSDIGKLYGYYDEMNGKGIEPNPITLEALLLAGLDHFGLKIKEDPENKESIKEELMKYIDWALMQYKVHNLTLNAHTQNKLQYKLDEIL